MCRASAKLPKGERMKLMEPLKMKLLPSPPSAKPFDGKLFWYGANPTHSYSATTHNRSRAIECLWGFLKAETCLIELAYHVEQFGLPADPRARLWTLDVRIPNCHFRRECNRPSINLIQDCRKAGIDAIISPSGRDPSGTHIVIFGTLPRGRLAGNSPLDFVQDVHEGSR